ncbi:uncharacterized protein LOC105201362 [Solenopsis invicta]|uniref:uncharacterized protein LOC105201362 n=1 Tax=Solenopsis invicta TaxID=13686 RepID=UPI0001FEC13A|nr:uncharacterized protein LOC105201362 [Solenopsis invicta]
MTRRGCRSFIQICACLAFITIVVADKEACNKRKCPGPLAYYENLSCIPVYEKEGDCCATKYNCDHLKGRSPYKCYVNNKEYEIREELRDEDKNRCEARCTCSERSDGFAAFHCSYEFCIPWSTKPGCYRKHSPLWCCPRNEVCPENPEDRAICIVNGKEYKDGEHFPVENEPDLYCVCQPGYEGNNVEPFCAKPRHTDCNPYFYQVGGIINTCAPKYGADQSPQVDCSFHIKCQEDDDIVIHNEPDISKSAEENFNDEDVCHFGNLTMHRGDELGKTVSYRQCVKCICEVPPVPTCQVLPKEGCSIFDKS